MTEMVAGAVGIGGPPVYAQADDAPVTIIITGPDQPPGFLPVLVTVHVNQTIVFLNNASPAASYQIVANDNSFNSPVLAPGQQWSFSIAQVGQYEYHEMSHADRMIGEIVVVSASTSLLPVPDPQAIATAQAVAKSQHQPTSKPAGATSLLLLLLLGSGFITLVIFLALIGFLVWYSRRHSRRVPHERLGQPMKAQDAVLTPPGSPQALHKPPPEAAASSAQAPIRVSGPQGAPTHTSPLPPPAPPSERAVHSDRPHSGQQ